MSGTLNPKNVDCGGTRYGLRHEQQASKEYGDLNLSRLRNVGVIISKN